MTSRGKDIYARMNNNEYAALSVMVGNDFFNSKMISVRGKIRNIGNARIMELFEANPYMYKIYPTENGQEVIAVFQIYEGDDEYIDFSTTPPPRDSFSFGGKEVSKHGYYITEECTSCALVHQTVQ
ncbi:hypothetical protein LL037_21750 [Clostridium estertheticum]|uniref:hypothetical protein n=1 Tax=Clostridium estertheticum TaxID=238834 RepID=UPI001C0D6F20|nr:hypothetical protein [Clostridium estertheticum]MBU3198369.1 hypothetical protein [Clostridium estertheticum]WAG65052.1 hypothetical protein LL037_21750 [Clostridium estertheticum]